jgi:hypothetical protein
MRALRASLVPPSSSGTRRSKRRPRPSDLRWGRAEVPFRRRAAARPVARRPAPQPPAGDDAGGDETLVRRPAPSFAARAHAARRDGRARAIRRPTRASRGRAEPVGTEGRAGDAARAGARAALTLALRFARHIHLAEPDRPTWRRRMLQAASRCC